MKNGQIYEQQGGCFCLLVVCLWDVTLASAFDGPTASLSHVTYLLRCADEVVERLFSDPLHFKLATSHVLGQ